MTNANHGSNITQTNLFEQNAVLTPEVSSVKEIAPVKKDFVSERVFSIEQINLLLKNIIDENIGYVWLKGEISNFKPHSSGHFYFSLKDSKSQITAMMFRGYNSKLKFKPHDGLEVIVKGKITIYEPRGTYSISCESMEPVGAGALQKQFEQLRDKLKNEGLFDPSRKKKIPQFPKQIAIVTSPTGAAIQDILNILNRRAKNLEVIVVPAVVQGAAAAQSIIEAFLKAQKLNPDVIIVGRGGGSIEDMWCFNDEKLAYTIAQSSVPVISAVGHEIDFTICDFVSDLRAPTPSAAAELVAKSSIEIEQKIKSLDKLLQVHFQKRLQFLKQRFLLSFKRLVDPKRKLQDYSIKNDELLTRLELSVRNYFYKKDQKIALLQSRLITPDYVLKQKNAELSQIKLKLNHVMNTILRENKNHLQGQMGLLDSLSPLRVVDRGYAIVTHQNRVLKSASDVQVGDEIKIKVSQGELQAIVK